MKKTKLLVMVAISAIALDFHAFAGEWKQESGGQWWYQNDDGSYPVNQWQEIGGQQYYFDGDGYMLSNTVTPDGKMVGADGALVQAQSLSNITYTSDSVWKDLSIRDWVYESSMYSTHIFEVANNSPHTLEINVNETAKDANGNSIGAHSKSESDIPSGCTVFICNLFSDVSGVKSFDTTIQTKVEKYSTPVLQNIALNVSNLGDKVVVGATNNGDIKAEFVEATAVFFSKGKPVYYSTRYLIDSDYELKPGSVISEQINCYSKKYDDVIVHLTGRG